MLRYCIGFYDHLYIHIDHDLVASNNDNINITNNLYNLLQYKKTMYELDYLSLR